MEDVEVVAPKQIARKKCEYEKERDANVATLTSLCKPLEDGRIILCTFKP
jgi:hypothetical protein